MRRVVLKILTAAVLVLFNVMPSAEANPIQVLDGAWFSCEFAHSQIAPDDGCQMLDDDGFWIVGEKIEYIKVSDSREQACRQNKAGNCFRRDQSAITVTRDSTGEFQPTAEGFRISYWGCAQDYKMERRGGFFEVSPIGELCYWTSDKRYFLARYTGNLEFQEEDTDSSFFAADR